jgi:FAD/FMN-containing dehydrogenase
MAGSVALAASSASRRPAAAPESIVVNDVHSQLNPTRVLGISQPGSLEDVQNLIRAARRDRKVISIAGGRCAMGGQQFGANTLLIDIRKMRRILTLDRNRGILEVEAGIEWPELIDGYFTLQNGDKEPWGIAQKQTGADRLTISGTIAANAHGRGLKMKPFVSDVESFVLVDATGTARTCSRTENSELFRLVHAHTNRREATDRRELEAVAVSCSHKRKAGIRHIRRLLSFYQWAGVLVRSPPAEYLPGQLPSRNRRQAPRSFSCD